MPDQILTNSKIVSAYRERTPVSARLAADAQRVLPSGITHDSRQCDPYGIYVERAEGSRKWDVDGNEYVDYFGGHGALLLGHNHPQVAEATRAALARGTHFGANHADEVRWAQQVCAMVPSAETVRFTSSGTEATLLALRLARAFNGKRFLVRIRRCARRSKGAATSPRRSSSPPAPASAWCRIPGNSWRRCARRRRRPARC